MGGSSRAVKVHVPPASTVTVPAVKPERPGATFRQMFESIQSGYAIQYRLPDGAITGAFRRVRVELAPGAGSAARRAGSASAADIR